MNAQDSEEKWVLPEWLRLMKEVKDQDTRSPEEKAADKAEAERIRKEAWSPERLREYDIACKHGFRF